MVKLMKIVNEDGTPVDTQKLLEELRDRVSQKGEITPEQKIVLLDIIEFWKGFKWVAKSMKVVVACVAGGAALVTSWDHIIKFLKH